MSSEVAVVILAGGEGSRIGGDKPLRLLGGERLIDRALRLARSWSEQVAIAVRDPAQLPSVDAEIIEDSPIEGPLGGLISGLHFARAEKLPLLLLIPADMPFLPSNLLDRLLTALDTATCAIASSAGHLHPVCGLWRAAVLDKVAAYVETGHRSLRGLAESAGVTIVDWPGGPKDPFFNINSPEDLAGAERRLSA